MSGTARQDAGWNPLYQQHLPYARAGQLPPMRNEPPQQPRQAQMQHGASTANHRSGAGGGGGGGGGGGAGQARHLQSAGPGSNVPGYYHAEPAVARDIPQYQYRHAARRAPGAGGLRPQELDSAEQAQIKQRRYNLQIWAPPSSVLSFPSVANRRKNPRSRKPKAHTVANSSTRRSHNRGGARGAASNRGSNARRDASKGRKQRASPAGRTHGSRKRGHHDRDNGKSSSSDNAGSPHLQQLEERKDAAAAAASPAPSSGSAQALPHQVISLREAQNQWEHGLRAAAVVSSSQAAQERNAAVTDETRKALFTYLRNPLQSQLFSDATPPVQISMEDVDMLLAKGLAGADTIVYLEALDAIGHKFSNVHALANAIRKAYEDASQRARTDRLMKAVRDDERQIVVEYLVSPECLLFEHAEYVQATQSELSRLILEGKSVQGTLRHLAALDAAGRRFESMSQLIFAISAAEMAREAGVRHRAALLEFFNSPRCKLWTNSANFEAANSSSISSGQGDPILITEPDIVRLYDEGTAGVSTMAHLEALQDAGRRFSSLEELISAVNLAHIDLERRRKTYFLGDFSPITDAQRRELLLFMNDPSCQLFLDASGMVVTKEHLNLLISEGKSVSGAKFYLKMLNSFARRYSDMEDLVMDVRAARINHSKELLQFLTGPTCRLFSGVLTHIDISMSAVERLQSESRAGPVAFDHCRRLNNAGARFGSFNALVTGVKEEHVNLLKELVDFRIRTLNYLYSPSCPLLPRDIVTSDAQVTRLFDMGGPDTLIHLQALANQRGAKSAPLYPTFAVLVDAVAREAQLAIGYKKEIFNHLVSAKSQLFVGGVTPASVRAAAIAAGRAPPPMSTSSNSMDAIQTSSRDSSKMMLQFSGTSEATSSSSSGSSGSALVSLSNANQAAGRLVPYGTVPGMHANGSGDGGDAKEAPMVDITVSDVNRLYHAGGAGDSTLKILWQFDVRGLQFSTFDELIVAVKAAHGSSFTKRNAARTLVLGFLSRADCSLFGSPTQITDADLDALVSAGSCAQDTVFYLSHLEWQQRQFSNCADLISAVHEQQVISVSKKAEILAFLHRPTCMLFRHNSAGALVSPADVDRLYIEGHAGPETIFYLIKLDQGSYEDRSVAQNESSLMNITRDAHGMMVSLQQAGSTIVDGSPNVVVDEPPSRPTTRVFDSIADLTAAVAEMHASSARIEKEMLKFFRSAECRLFLDSTGNYLIEPQQFTSRDIDRLLLQGGAGDDTLQHLRTFNSSHLRFRSLDDLIRAVQDAHGRLQKVRSVDLERILKRLQDPASQLLGDHESSQLPLACRLTLADIEYWLLPAAEKNCDALDAFLDELEFTVRLKGKGFSDLQSLAQAVSVACDSGKAREDEIYRFLHSPRGSQLFSHTFLDAADEKDVSSMGTNRASKRQVHQLYIFGRAGPQTLPFLRQFSFEKQQFASMDDLTAAIRFAQEQLNQAQVEAERSSLAYLAGTGSHLLSNASASGSTTITDAMLAQIVHAAGGARSNPVALLRLISVSNAAFASVNELLEAVRTEAAKVGQVKKRALLFFNEGEGRPLFSMPGSGAYIEPESLMFSEAEMDIIFEQGGAGPRTLRHLQRFCREGRTYNSARDLYIDLQRLEKETGELVEAQMSLTLAFLSGEDIRERWLAGPMQAALDAQGDGSKSMSNGQGSAQEHKTPAVPRCNLLSDDHIARHITLPEIRALYQQGNAGLQTLPHLLRFTRWGRRYHSLHELGEALRTHHMNTMQLSEELLAHLTHRSCGLFSASPHPVEISPLDIARLLHEGGAEAHTIKHLWAFDAQHRKFVDFDALIAGVKAAHQELSKKHDVHRSMILEYLNAPDVRILSSNNQFNHHDAAAAVAAGSSITVDMSSRDLDDIFEAAGSSGPSAVYHLTWMNEHGRRFSNAADLVFAIQKAHSEFIAQKKQVFAMVHDQNQAPLLVEPSPPGSGLAPKRLRFSMDDVESLYSQGLAGLDTLKHLNSARASGWTATSFKELIAMLRHNHSNTQQRRRELLHVLRAPTCRLFSRAPPAVLASLSLGDVGRIMIEGRAEPDTEARILELNAAGRKFNSLDELIAAIRKHQAHHVGRMARVAAFLNGARGRRLIRPPARRAGAPPSQIRPFVNADVLAMMSAVGSDAQDTFVLLWAFSSKDKQYPSREHMIEAMRQEYEEFKLEREAQGNGLDFVTHLHRSHKARFTLAELEQLFPGGSEGSEDLASVIRAAHAEAVEQKQQLYLFLKSDTCQVFSGAPHVQDELTPAQVDAFYYDCGAEYAALGHVKALNSERSKFRDMNELSDAVRKAEEDSRARVHAASRLRIELAHLERSESNRATSKPQALSGADEQTIRELISDPAECCLFSHLQATLPDGSQSGMGSKVTSQDLADLNAVCGDVNNCVHHLKQLHKSNHRFDQFDDCIRACRSVHSDFIDSAKQAMGYLFDSQCPMVTREVSSRLHFSDVLRLVRVSEADKRTLQHLQRLAEEVNAPGGGGPISDFDEVVWRVGAAEQQYRIDQAKRRNQMSEDEQEARRRHQAAAEEKRREQEAQVNRAKHEIRVFLAAPSTKLFLPGSIHDVAVTDDNLLLLFQAAGGSLPLCISHLRDLNQQVDERQFRSFPELISAVQQQHLDALRQKSSVLQYLRDSSCPLWKASNPARVSAGDVDLLYEQGGAGIQTLPVLQQFASQNTQFEDMQELTTTVSARSRLAASEVEAQLAADKAADDARKAANQDEAAAKAAIVASLSSASSASKLFPRQTALTKGDLHRVWLAAEVEPRVLAAKKVASVRVNQAGHSASAQESVPRKFLWASSGGSAPGDVAVAHLQSLGNDGATFDSFGQLVDVLRGRAGSLPEAPQEWSPASNVELDEKDDDDVFVVSGQRAALSASAAPTLLDDDSVAASAGAAALQSSGPSPRAQLVEFLHRPEATRLFSASVPLNDAELDQLIAAGPGFVRCRDSLRGIGRTGRSFDNVLSLVDAVQAWNQRLPQEQVDQNQLGHSARSSVTPWVQRQFAPAPSGGRDPSASEIAHLTNFLREPQSHRIFTREVRVTKNDLALLLHAGNGDVHQTLRVMRALRDRGTRFDSFSQFGGAITRYLETEQSSGGGFDQGAQNSRLPTASEKALLVDFLPSSRLFSSSVNLDNRALGQILSAGGDDVQSTLSSLRNLRDNGRKFGSVDELCDALRRGEGAKKARATPAQQELIKWLSAPVNKRFFATPQRVTLPLLSQVIEAGGGDVRSIIPRFDTWRNSGKRFKSFEEVSRALTESAPLIKKEDSDLSSDSAETMVVSAEDRQKLIQWMSQPQNAVFSQSVSVREADIARLISSAGGSAEEAIIKLGILVNHQRKFASFPDLIAAVANVGGTHSSLSAAPAAAASDDSGVASAPPVQPRALTQEEQNKLIQFLGSSDHRLFSKSVEVTQADLENLLAAAGNDVDDAVVFLQAVHSSGQRFETFDELNQAVRAHHLEVTTHGVRIPIPIAVRCYNLPWLDGPNGKSDPLVAFFVRNHRTGQYEFVGKTERITDSENPIFSSTVAVNQFSEVDTEIRACVYDCDDGSNLLDVDPIGAAVFSLRAIVDADETGVTLPLVLKGSRVGNASIMLTANPATVAAQQERAAAFRDEAQRLAAEATAVANVNSASLKAQDSSNSAAVAQAAQHQQVAAEQDAQERAKIEAEAAQARQAVLDQAAERAAAAQLQSAREAEEAESAAAAAQNAKNQALKEAAEAAAAELAAKAAAKEKEDAERALRAAQEAAARIEAEKRSQREREEAEAAEQAAAASMLAAQAAAEQAQAQAEQEAREREAAEARAAEAAMVAAREAAEAKAAEERAARLAARGTMTMVPVQFACTGLPSLDLTSASDPLVAVFAQSIEDDDGSWKFVGKTERIMNDNNPIFQKAIDVQHWIGSDTQLRVCVYDCDDGDNLNDVDPIGAASVSLHHLVARPAVDGFGAGFPLRHQGKDVNNGLAMLLANANPQLTQAAQAAAEEARIASERAEAQRVAEERAAAERLAAEKFESERIATEKAEADRLAAEKSEQERLAAEKAEQERIAAEKAEQERLATLAILEEDRRQFGIVSQASDPRIQQLLHSVESSPSDDQVSALINAGGRDGNAVRRYILVIIIEGDRISSWNELVAAVGARHAAGPPPSDERLQALSNPALSKEEKNRLVAALGEAKLFSQSVSVSTSALAEMAENGGGVDLSIQYLRVLSENGEKFDSFSALDARLAVLRAAGPPTSVKPSGSAVAPVAAAAEGSAGAGNAGPSNDTVVTLNQEGKNKLVAALGEFKLFSQSVSVSTTALSEMAAKGGGVDSTIDYLRVLSTNGEKFDSFETLDARLLELRAAGPPSASAATGGASIAEDKPSLSPADKNRLVAALGQAKLFSQSVSVSTSALAEMARNGGGVDFTIEHLQTLSTNGEKFESFDSLDARLAELRANPDAPSASTAAAASTGSVDTNSTSSASLSSEDKNKLVSALGHAKLFSQNVSVSTTALANSSHAGGGVDNTIAIIQQLSADGAKFESFAELDAKIAQIRSSSSSSDVPASVATVAGGRGDDGGGGGNGDEPSSTSNPAPFRLSKEDKNKLVAALGEFKLFSQSVSVSTTALSEMASNGGGVDPTIEYLRALSTNGEKFESFETLDARLLELRAAGPSSASAAAGGASIAEDKPSLSPADKNRLVAALGQAKLFSQSVSVSTSALAEMARNGGGVDSTIEYLQALSTNGEKFESFDSLDARLAELRANPDAPSGSTAAAASTGSVDTNSTSSASLSSEDKNKLVSALGHAKLFSQSVSVSTTALANSSHAGGGVDNTIAIIQQLSADGAKFESFAELDAKIAQIRSSSSSSDVPASVATVAGGRGDGGGGGGNGDEPSSTSNPAPFTLSKEDKNKLVAALGASKLFSQSVSVSTSALAGLAAAGGGVDNTIQILAQLGSAGNKFKSFEELDARVVAVRASA